MIYLQSHTGLCHYPTKSGKTHAYFAKNPRALNELIDKCKQGGMKVVGYYSLIFNNWAADTYPEWEMVNADGTTWRDHGQRYGLCCPNNEEYRSFVVTQMQEMAELFPTLDGIFYDMPYWEVLRARLVGKKRSAEKCRKSLIGKMKNGAFLLKNVKSGWRSLQCSSTDNLKKYFRLPRVN